MRPFRTIAAIAAAAVICCSAAALTGCASKGGSDKEPISGTVYSPQIPDNPVGDDVPGTEQASVIGELVNFQDKLDITLDQVMEIDDVDKTSYRVLSAEFTLTNKSDKDIDCSTLTHFGTVIDGAEAKAPVRDVTAAVVARKYYTSIKSDLQSLNQAIKPGETIKGYAYILAPSAWQEMKLVYTPFKYYSNDCVVFNLEESKFAHYSGDIG